MMYIIRKEPYEQTIPEIKKTNGEIIPKRTFLTEDRAIFKHKNCDKFYRQTFYPNMKIQPYNDIELFKTDDLKEVKNIRKRLFEYCGDWFDIYDEKGKTEF